MYVGETEFGAFAEAFCHDEGSRVVVESTLRLSCLCPISVDGTVRLVDLTSGPSLRRLGADVRVASGFHDLSRRWALALCHHPDRPDGVYYRSRLSPELFSIALFERVSELVVGDCRPNILTQPDRLGAILDYLEIALIPE